MNSGEVFNATMPPKIGGDEDMAILVCGHCKKRRTINQNADEDETLALVVTCSGCGGRTYFEMVGDAVTFTLGGGDFLGTFGEAFVPIAISDRFDEAKICFQVRAFRAAAAMARSCVEMALSEHGITKGNLESRIKRAKDAGMLTDEEVSLAHGSRLVGNNALHKQAVVTAPYAQSALQAAAGVVSKLLG